MKVVTAKEAELENKDDDEEAKAASDKGIKSLQISVKGHEGPIEIQMNTAALENKISALTIIRGLAETLGKAFFDFVEPVSQLLVTELMHF